MDKLNKGREYRDLHIEIKEAQEDEANEYRVQGYATTYEEPYTLYKYSNDDGYIVEVQEMVDRHAFDNTDMSDVIMQYDHQGRVFARLSNGTLKLNPADEKGLYIDGYLGGTEIGRQLYEEIKGGYTSKMSFGFTVRGEDFHQVSSNKTGETWLRTITDIGKLYDVSAVSLPANDMTSISARKYCDGVIADIEAERLKKAEEEAERQLIEERRKDIETRIKALKGGN